RRTRLAGHLAGGELVAALAERQQECGEKRTDDEPRAERDADGDHARHGPEYEPDGDEQYVDQHDILEIQRVRRVLDQIGDDDRDEQRAERVREREARDEQGDRERTRRLDAYLSARDRPVALLGMFAVLLDVADVVEDVGRAGDRTE